MKKVIKEINEGKNLEMNLPIYADYLINLYNKYAYVEVSMNYYTFYEMIADGAFDDNKLKVMAEEFNNIIKDFVLCVSVDKKREIAINKIDSLRNKVYKIVDILAAYADIFSRYEYVSNRCEYLFKDSDIDVKYTDEDFTREIMQYIFSEEDNSVINSKICEVVAELPLRLTKNKFFELLCDGLSVYKNTDKATIDDFIYVLKSSAMLALPEDINEYEELNSIYEMVKNINYSEISKEQFINLENELRYAADFIEKETNMFMMLQDLINKVYVLIIAAPYGNSDDKQIECCKKIISEISNEFDNSQYISLPDEITDLFVFLEGTIEEIQGKINTVEYTLDNIKNNHLGIVKSIMANNIYQGLFISENLMTDSLFVDLSVSKNVFNRNVVKDRDIDIEKYISEVRDEMVKLLSDFFKENQKQVNRSVMALIISRLPVFFNNITEIQDYIYNSLSNCTNKSEKCAAVEIIKCIINEN